MIGVVTGDCLDALPALPDGYVQTCITSPPYFGLRDYGHDGQLGLEPTPDEFVAALVTVFREVRRVLRDDGTVWLNLGDSYNNRTKVRKTSHQPALNGFTDDNWHERAARGGVRMTLPAAKEKDLLGIPWMVAFALRADGWYLRSEIIWHKPNPMPESVTDRPTKSHEQVFLLSKGPRYFYDADAIREDAIHEGRIVKASGDAAKNGTGSTDTNDRRTAAGFTLHDTTVAGRNKRSVWTVATQPYPGAHFATFPAKLIEPCILAGCPERACGVCGAPWQRVVERQTGKSWHDHSDDDGIGQRQVKMGQASWDDHVPARTVGWEPSCAHDAPTVPGVVLDPFAGAGTVGVVCGQLGRCFIGIELKPEYADMARERIVKEGRPGNRRHDPPKVLAGQLELAP